MVIERTKEEVIIRLPASVVSDDLQDFLNYARYKELSSKFDMLQEEVNKLANEINVNWRKKERAKSGSTF
jgi:hypothetical protein